MRRKGEIEKIWGNLGNFRYLGGLTLESQDAREVARLALIARYLDNGKFNKWTSDDLFLVANVY